MTPKDEIQKMHEETCYKELKEASKLTGKETDKELDKILEKCQCIQISILHNGFSELENRIKEGCKCNYLDKENSTKTHEIYSLCGISFRNGKRCFCPRCKELIKKIDGGIRHSSQP